MASGKGGAACGSRRPGRRSAVVGGPQGDLGKPRLLDRQRDRRAGGELRRDRHDRRRRHRLDGNATGGTATGAGEGTIAVVGAADGSIVIGTPDGRTAGGTATDGAGYSAANGAIASGTGA